MGQRGERTGVICFRDDLVQRSLGASTDRRTGQISSLSGCKKKSLVRDRTYIADFCVGMCGGPERYSYEVSWKEAPT